MSLTSAAEDQDILHHCHMKTELSLTANTLSHPSLRPVPPQNAQIKSSRTFTQVGHPNAPECQRQMGVKKVNPLHQPEVPLLLSAKILLQGLQGSGFGALGLLLQGKGTKAGLAVQQ